jgi:basic amino acid/polyamine antiporter, APA family
MASGTERPAAAIADSGGATGGFYARRASGLVRQLSLRDSILLNICYISFPLGLVYITQIGGLFPGVSLGLAFLLAGLIAIPHVFAYGLFAGVMPRSGGDYLSISRAIHPFWGFVVNATFTVLQIFSTAFIINFVPLFALPSLFSTLFVVTGDHSWATAATDVATQTGQFLIAGGLIVIIGLLAIFNIRLMLRVFTVLMVLSLLGVAATLISLLFINQSDLANGFAQFGSTTHIINQAHSQGLASSTFSLGVTFASITILFGAVGLGQVSSYFAGEIRQPSNTILKGMLISLAITVVGFSVIAFLSVHAFGSDFLNSSQFLSNAGKWPIAASPFINLFIGIAAPHVWLAVLLGIGTVAGVWAVAAPTFLMATRNLLAHSFDRVLPAALGDVNERTHTPILGTLVVMVIMLGFLAGFVYSATSFTVYLAVSNLVVFATFASVGLAAVLFPYRRKKMYEESGITKRKIVGLPLLVVVGAADAVLMTLYLILLFTNNAATGVENGSALKALGIVVAILALIWVLAWARARNRGLDLDVVQTQLPPE